MKPQGIALLVDERTGMDRPSEPLLGGIPIARGVMTGGGWFELDSSAGQKYLVEGSPAAFWPDGSVKWLHLCGQADLAGGKVNRFALRPAAEPQAKLTARVVDNKVEIRGGILDVDIQSDAADVLSVRRDGVPLLKSPGISSRMVYQGPDGQNRRAYSLSFQGPPRIVVETANRVVVRVGGLFASGEKTIGELVLFFEVLRQTPEIRLEPAWIYLGRPAEDLTGELSLTVHRPVQTEDAFYAFGNEQGMGYWDVLQPIRQPAPGGPRWPMVRQVQLGSSFYRTEKLTFAKDASWLKILEGRRAPGWCFLGDKQSGLTAAMRYFWQEYPHSLAVNCSEGTITFGLVPPEAGPLDWRRYSPVVYGPPVYEYHKYSETACATGLGKAHELMLRFETVGQDLLPEAPPRPQAATRPAAGDYQQRLREEEQRLARLATARREIARRALAFVHPCRLMTEGDYFASTRVLGQLAAVNAAERPKMEKDLADMMAYLQRERDFRGWYGLLDFGDMMFSYNAYKDMWAYDDGGHAWANTESLPDYGLWIQSLRSGRSDWVELAIEMSRHNRDVDTYHRGPMLGAGSRHGVNHWSDGDKEWRVALPLVRRLHYYTTADPWTAECILDTVAAYQAKSMVNRMAPSMSSAFAALLVRWEMTHDPETGQALANFADVMASGFLPDGRPVKSLDVNLATGVGKVADASADETKFFLDSFGGQDALCEYAELTDHKALSDAIVRYTRWWIGKNNVGNIAILPFLAHSYRATGDPVLLRIIRHVMDGPMLSLTPLGGKGVLDEPPHEAIPYSRAKQLGHYLCVKMHCIPYGLAAEQGRPLK